MFAIKQSFVFRINGEKNLSSESFFYLQIDNSHLSNYVFFKNDLESIKKKLPIKNSIFIRKLFQLVKQTTLIYMRKCDGFAFKLH